MMNSYTFTEWALDRGLEETALHAFKRSGAHMSSPKPGDLIITNAKSFMDSLISPKKGLLKNGGKTRISKSSISKGSIIGINNDGKPLLRILSYDRGKPFVVHPSLLLDVSPAFDEDFGDFQDLIGDSRQNVFLFNPDRQPNNPGVNKSHEKVKALWSRWWHQVSRPQADINQTKMAGEIFGDQELVKRQQRDLADSEKRKEADGLVRLIRSVKMGSQEIGSAELLSLIKSRLSDAEDVRWFRKNGYGDVVDLLHDADEKVAGEEYRKIEPEPASPLDQLMQPKSVVSPEDVPGEPKPLQMGNPRLLAMTNRLKQRTYKQEVPDQDLEIAHFNPWRQHSDTKIYEKISLKA